MFMTLLSLEEKKRAIAQHYLQQRQLPPANLTAQLQTAEGIEKTYGELTQKPGVIVLADFTKPSRKWTVQDFVGHYAARYKAITKMLQQRQELTNLTSIQRLTQKQAEEKVSVIGMILNKEETKNKNLILTLEDQTGTIKAIVSKKKASTFTIAQDCVPDEVIGVTGAAAQNCMFVDNIIFPDIPATNELKKAPDEAYVAALSCLHIGSKKFLRPNFLKFTQWLRGEVGTPEQQAIAQKVKYIFLVGDIVDGIGVYPRQEDGLEITDIYEQHKEAARLLSMIPQDKHIILLSGNHEGVRLGEPQPRPSEDFCAPLLELPNVIPISNPGWVNIHASESFPGFNCLLYHGHSYIYYGENVPSIKKLGANVSERVTGIMKFLLQRRHLAPTHGSTLIIPDPEIDPLVMERIPDIFVSGHLHKTGITTYRGVLCVSASCFQEKTDYMEKFGIEPDPCHVPLINLHTREVTMVRFDK